MARCLRSAVVSTFAADASDNFNLKMHLKLKLSVLVLKWARSILLVCWSISVCYTSEHFQYTESNKLRVEAGNASIEIFLRLYQLTLYGQKFWTFEPTFHVQFYCLYPGNMAEIRCCRQSRNSLDYSELNALSSVIL